MKVILPCKDPSTEDSSYNSIALIQDLAMALHELLFLEEI
jgi:hypothetical protein